MDDLTQAQCDALIARRDVAHIGVISDGEPYVTPVSYVRSGDELLFRTVGGRRLDAIRSNPWVCLEVSEFLDDTGRWESVVVWGTAYEVLDQEREAEAVEQLLRKYYSDEAAPVRLGSQESLPGLVRVVAVPMERVTGKASGSGFGARTRPGRL